MLRIHLFGNQLSGHIPSPVFKTILYTYFQITDTFARWNSNYIYVSFPHHTAGLNVLRDANPLVFFSKGFLGNPECHHHCNLFGPCQDHIYSGGHNLILNNVQLFLRKHPQNVCMSCPLLIVLLQRFSVHVHSTGALPLASKARLTPSHPLRSPPGATGQGLCPMDWTAEMWYLKGMADPMCSSCWAVYHSSGL